MGFLISKEFPSRFISGSEVAGHIAPLVIAGVKKEKAYSPKTNKNEDVLVVYFEGKDRGVRLGKERAREICTAVGSEDTDDWKGKAVVIYTEKKNAFGATRDIIHFRAKE